MKAHFDKGDYDFIKYGGKSKVSRDSFYKRNDRIFFVKLTRKYKSKDDIQDYLLSNFLIYPKGWVGKFHEDNYIEWQIFLIINLIVLLEVVMMIVFYYHIYIYFFHSIYFF